MIDDERIAAAIEQFLAHPPYENLLLLTPTDMARLPVVGQWWAQRFGWPVLSLARELNPQLVALTPERRERQADKRVGDLFARYRSGPILCTDITILFEPTLHLDPLRLLRRTSKSVQLIVLWPGSANERTLTYAVPDHAHHRFWPIQELCAYCWLQL